MQTIEQAVTIDKALEEKEKGPFFLSLCTFTL